MNNLRKIFCVVLVLSLLCGVFALSISAETSTETTPVRTFATATDALVVNGTASSASGNLFSKYKPLTNAGNYDETIKEYVVSENGNGDYYLARVESNGETVTGSGHSYIELLMKNGVDSSDYGYHIKPGDVVVYETDMYFEAGTLSGLYFAVLMRDGVGAAGGGGSRASNADYNIYKSFPSGEWFHFTMIGDATTNNLYYYINGERVGNVRTGGISGNNDIETLNYYMHGVRWQLNNATLSHGEGIAFDNVYMNVITRSDLGSYTVGADTLEGFDGAQDYTLRDVLPLASIDGTTYYTIAEINTKLESSTKPVEVEILRDGCGVYVVPCDATIKTNGINIIVKATEGASIDTSEEGYIKVSVPYMPAYTTDTAGNGASSVLSDSSNLLNNGSYKNDFASFFDAVAVKPMGSSDTYYKVSPKFDGATGKNAYVEYTANKKVELDGYYVIDFDIATEGEHIGLTLNPLVRNVKDGAVASKYPNGSDIKYTDFTSARNEWTHVTVIADMANNVMYLFVDGALVNAEYGVAYKADQVIAGHDLYFKGIRFNITTSQKATTSQSTMLDNLTARVFDKNENGAITTAVANKTLSDWTNSLYKGNAALPGIITIDDANYGNSIVASEALATEGDKAKNVSFLADFKHPVVIKSSVVLDTNGIGAYQIVNGGEFKTEINGEDAIVAAPYSVQISGEIVRVTKITAANADETCTSVYWGTNADFDEYVTIYYPAGTEISYIGDESIIPKNVIKDGMLTSFVGWVNENEEIVDRFGIAKAGDSFSYYLAVEESATDITLPGAMYNLSLYSNYAINLFIPAELYVGEATNTTTAGGIQYVVLTEEVASTEISKAVEFVVTYTYGAVEYTEYLEVSVLEYAETVMASNYSDMLKKTIMAALNYSETAVEELVDQAGDEDIKAILNAEANAKYLPSETANYGESVDLSGLNFFEGAFIHIDATPDFVFVVSDSFVGTITFTYTGVDGVVTVPKEVDASENIYVVLDDVKVYDMAQTITITAEGTISGTGVYNLSTYINEAPEELGGSNTAKALYVYSTIAKAYKLACNKVAG